jgi:hypothetical protein
MEMSFRTCLANVGKVARIKLLEVGTEEGGGTFFEKKKYKFQKNNFSFWRWICR